MRILITGKNGQLGQEFINFFENKNHDIFAFSHSELDITNFNKLNIYIENIKPDLIINCAAYNKIDQAEKDPYLNFLINYIGVYNLVLCLEKFNCFLIHYSTDYVFDGIKNEPYKEEEKKNPINKYGLSKSMAEDIIINNLDNYLIFRVSWLYGKGKRNFLYKLMKWKKTNS